MESKPAHRLVRLAIALIGLHSVALGLCLLFLPVLMLKLLRFSTSTDPFFPAQSGIFLFILGLVYLRALKQPAFIEVILLSKGCAVVFLVGYALLAPAPIMIWAAAFGDLSMLVGLSAVLFQFGGRA